MSSSQSLSLQILSPEGIILNKDNLEAVSVPLADGGSIGIRPGHAPLIAETIRGIIKYRTKMGQNSIEVHPGVLEIRDNSVIIMTAGEVNQTSEELADRNGSEFNRLMQTLANTIEPQNEIG